MNTECSPSPESINVSTTNKYIYMHIYIYIYIYIYTHICIDMHEYRMQPKPRIHQRIQRQRHFPKLPRSLPLALPPPRRRSHSHLAFFRAISPALSLTRARQNFILNGPGCFCFVSKHNIYLYIYRALLSECYSPLSEC